MGGSAQYIIGQANVELDDRQSHIIPDRVAVRKASKFTNASGKDKVDFIDVSPKQVVSIASSLIPFFEHDDANRALMGFNVIQHASPS